jgi:hypothetical protein
MGVLLFALVRTVKFLLLYARLGVYRPPSWWSTTNRSGDKHPTVSDQFSVLPVASSQT